MAFGAYSLACTLHATAVTHRCVLQRVAGLVNQLVSSWPLLGLLLFFLPHLNLGDTVCKEVDCQYYS